MKNVEELIALVVLRISREVACVISARRTRPPVRSYCEAIDAVHVANDQCFDIFSVLSVAHVPATQRLSSACANENSRTTPSRLSRFRAQPKVRANVFARRRRRAGRSRYTNETNLFR